MSKRIDTTPANQRLEPRLYWRYNLRHILLLFLLLLSGLSLSGCGSSFQDQPTGGTPPPTGSATIVVNHVLARAVPSTIEGYRFTGADAQGQVVFGPLSRPRTASVTLANVPLTTKAFTIEYLSSGQIVGRFQVAVTLSAGQTLVIDDPAWQDVTNIPPATKLGVLASPALGAPNQTLTPPLRIAVLDANSQLVSSSTASVSLSVGSGPGSLGGTVVANAVNGVATFDNLTLSSDGTYTLLAQSSGLTSVSTTSISIVSAPAAASLSFSTQPVDSNSYLPAIDVTVLDQFGAPFTAFNGPVTLALGTNPSGATLTGPLTVNAVNGVATFSNILVTLSGTDYTLIASATGLTPATSGAFDVTRGQLSRSLFSIVHPLEFLGTLTDSMDAADFNGDGRTDVLTGSSSTDHVYLLLQTEAGDLEKVSISVPDLLLVRTGDFNGDGIQDLVSLNGTTGAYRLEVRHGDGQANFSAPLVTTLSNAVSSPSDLVVFDLNSNGIDDIAISASTSGVATILVSVSDGNSLGTPTGVPVNGPPTSNAGIAAGQLGGTPYLDLAIAAGNGVQLFQGDGAGGFTYERTLSTAVNEPSSAVTIADFNSDGVGDVVLAQNESGGSSSLSIFLSSGGSYSAPFTRTEQSSHFPIRGLATGDFDGNGTLDILAVTQKWNVQGTSDLLLFLTDPGTNSYFNSSTYLNVGNAFQAQVVAAADLNNDGFFDAVVGRTDTTVLRINGDGQGRLLPSDSRGSDQRSAAVGDLDGDSRTDLVVTGALGTRIYLRAVGGEIPTSPSQTLFDEHTAVALGDADGDGTLDIFRSNNNSVALHLNPGTGVFPAATTTVAMPQNVVTLEVADLNGDGHADILSCNGTASQLVLALSNGPASYQSSVTLPTSGVCRDIAVVDLDGDGDLDIVTAQGANGLGVFTNNAGVFTESTVPVAGEIVAAVAAGDLNNDGSPDLAIGTDGQTGFGTIRTLLNDGTGVLTAGATTTAPGLNKAVELRVQDANGDSVNDILVLDLAAYGCAVLTGAGDGLNFANGSMLYVGGEPSGPRTLVLLDIDGDGVVEPLFTRFGSAGGTLSSLLTLLGLLAAGSWVRRRRAA